MSKRIDRRMNCSTSGLGSILREACLLVRKQLVRKQFLDNQLAKRHPWLGGFMALGLILSLLGSQAIAQPTIAQSAAAKPALIVYPPPNHETSADRIFLIGSAPPAIATVTINGQAVRRSKTGNFAPSFPLQVGANAFTLRAGSQTLNLSVKRLPTTAPDTLSAIQPDRDIVRRPGDWVCFGATAPKGAKVSVQLGDRRLDLAPIGQTLPENSAVLVNQNAPIAADTLRGCTQFAAATSLVPQFQMVRSGGGTSPPARTI
jgi:N-acetylmuramoyl-L-alanine amidase